MAHRARVLGLLGALGAVSATSACAPTTSGGDDSGADLAPRTVDLLSCAPPAGNLLANASFEAGEGSARNTGAPASSIASWDGCCNLEGQGLTTTWQVSRGGARCGAASLSVTAAAARGDVLNQERTVSDGAGRPFSLTAWALVQRADPGAALSIDLFDLTAGRVLLTSPALAAAAADWIELSAGGQLPGGPAPHVQVRVHGKGTLTALVDDIALVLR